LTDSVDKARQYALKLLGYRGRSEHEIMERLMARGFSADVIASTVLHLKEIGLLNDLSLAETLTREATTNRMLSRAGARAHLMKRGIPKGMVDSVIVLDDASDYDNAVRFAGKKLRALKKYPPAIAKRRLYNLLLRRGYSPEVIIKVLKHEIAKEDDQ